MARNSNYRDTYGGMDARSGQFKQMSAASNGRKDNMMRSGAESDTNRDETGVRVSPRQRKTRSRSPLRTNPPEVFGRSPRSNRHYEDGMESAAAGGHASGRRVSPGPIENRPQQAKHMNAGREAKPAGSDSAACLDWLHKNCFKEILAIERNIEDRKLTLARQPDFSLEQAFVLFSDTSLARLSVSDMVSGFEKLGITCAQDDARLLVSRYDADDDLRLGFWEFANMFLPIDLTYREDLERRKTDCYAGLSGETKHLL